MDCALINRQDSAGLCHILHALAVIFDMQHHMCSESHMAQSNKLDPSITTLTSAVQAESTCIQHADTIEVLTSTTPVKSTPALTYEVAHHGEILHLDSQVRV